MEFLSKSGDGTGSSITGYHRGALGEVGIEEAEEQTGKVTARRKLIKYINYDNYGKIQYLLFCQDDRKRFGECYAMRNDTH